MNNDDHQAAHATNVERTQSILILKLTTSLAQAKSAIDGIESVLMTVQMLPDMFHYSTILDDAIHALETVQNRAAVALNSTIESRV